MTPQLRSLAIDHLKHESVRFADQLDPEVMMAAALKFGTGLDHFTGEEVIAVVDESKYAQVAADIMSWVSDSVDARMFHGVVITDRQMIGGEPTVCVPLDHIHGASVRGLVLKTVDLHTPHGAQGFEVEAAPDIAHFVSAMVAQLPPGIRTGAARELCRPSPGDPLGVLDLINTPPGDDLRAHQLVAIASAMHHRGNAEQQQRAFDLAWRASLFSRTVRLGRGSHGGRWISPLQPGDFAAAIVQMFGAPTRAWTDPSGAWCYEFVVEGGVAEAALKSAAGMAAGMLVGIGGVVLPQRSVAAVTCCPVGQYTGFTLRTTTGTRGVGAGGEDLQQREWAHVALGAFEGRALLLRGVYGPSAPLPQLLAVDPRTIVEYLTPQLGVCELGAFYPEYGQGQLSAMSPEIAAAIASVQSKSDEERATEARAAWAAALEHGGRDAMADAALGLQHVMAYEECMQAYRTLAERHPTEQGDAWRGVGDCHLFRAEMGGGGESDYAAAIAAYEYAMQQPAQRRDGYAYNYYEAAAGLFKADPGAGQGRAALQRYLHWFPHGEHERDAKRLLEP